MVGGSLKSYERKEVKNHEGVDNKKNNQTGVEDIEGGPRIEISVKSPGGGSALWR